MCSKQWHVSWQVAGHLWVTWDLVPQPHWSDREKMRPLETRDSGWEERARGALGCCACDSSAGAPGCGGSWWGWGSLGLGSWGPGKTRVPHPSDPESFPRFCPGLGLVAAPCQTEPGLWRRAPVPHTPWPGTGQKTGAPRGFRPECREARALSGFGRGGLPHAPQLGASPSWYQPGGLPCAGHAQGGRDVWEHV